VRDFVRSLERADLSVWIEERDLPPETVVNQKINKALRGSDIIVSILQEKAIDSPNVFFELGVAVAMRKQMVVVVPPNFNRALLPGPLRERSFLVKGTPNETAQSVASLAINQSADELSDSELKRIAQHITNYLKASNFTVVSFERIRERTNPNYTDELLLAVIDRLPETFRRVRLKGGKAGIGLVKG
jgi:hypothetical protein